MARRTAERWLLARPVEAGAAGAGGRNWPFHLRLPLPAGNEQVEQDRAPAVLLHLLELARPFAHDIGYDGPPCRWDPDRRFLLRCELDAAFFHLYGLSHDDTDYVMDTFPIVRKHDEKAHGEYRTKRVILEIYDAMADAARTGKPCQTRLDPPSADPRVAHPDTRPPAGRKGR